MAFVSSISKHLLCAVSPVDNQNTQQKKGSKEAWLEEEAQKGEPLNWILKRELPSLWDCFGLFPMVGSMVNPFQKQVH